MYLARSSPRRLLCLSCQWRSFSTSYQNLAQQARKSTPVAPSKTVANPEPNVPRPPKFVAPSPLEDAPRSYGKRLESFTPQPLPRPIGMPWPPLPGENTGKDNRSVQERRDDFVNYTKHLERREQLKSKMSRPYFRDWGNLQFHKGKTFIAPPRLFRADLSLFFPNMYGRTLLKSDSTPRDTTPTLAGKISVVSVFSGVWAENQAKSFAGVDKNPALAKLIEDNAERLQAVHINVEDDPLKFWLIKMFIGGLRKTIGEANWDKYFIVRNAIPDDIREAVGLLNSKVGYVFLLDSQCRIRWAGSGDSEDHEREGLVKGAQRLLAEEMKNVTHA